MSERSHRIFDSEIALFCKLLNGVSPTIRSPDSVFLFKIGKDIADTKIRRTKAIPKLRLSGKRLEQVSPAQQKKIRREGRRNEQRGETESDWESFIWAIDAAKLPGGPIRRAYEKPGDTIELAKLAAKRSRAASAARLRKDILKKLIRKAKQWRRKPLKVLQEHISPLLWRCVICTRYFLAPNGRKRLYCSDRCKNRRPKRDLMKDLRKRTQEQKMNRVGEAVAAWDGQGDWKAIVAAKTGVSKNWLTYRVNAGDLQQPKAPHIQSHNSVQKALSTLSTLTPFS